MKKVLLFLLCVMFLITGCSSDEKDTFEHYDLKDKDMNRYAYIDDDGKKHIYVLADITPDNYLSFMTGLFYEVDDSDYILLEKLESSQEDAYSKDYIYQFYDNKLYGTYDSGVFEIELSGKESKLKELKFKIDGKKIGFVTVSIKGVSKESILLSSNIFIGEHSEYRELNCSLKNYECSMEEK